MRAGRGSYPSAGTILTPHGWQGGVQDSLGARAATVGRLEFGGGSADCRQQAGAARQVPGPVYALPPILGAGGASQGGGVSRVQRSRSRVEDIGGQDPNRQ